MSLKSIIFGASLAQLSALTAYAIACLGVIDCYSRGQHYLGFYLSALLIAVGLVITIVSMRRYRQRLNYVEGLERAIHDHELSEGDPKEVPRLTALQHHWIDALGDRGVGLINFLMILVAVPGVLGHASLLPQFSLFEAQSVESHGFGFGTWAAFVAIESVGFIGLIFDHFGLEELSEIASLGDRFTEYWQWFMALVQVGLLSLAFDVFRRYLDLSSTLDRFIKSIALSGDELCESAESLQKNLSAGQERDLHIERALLTVYRGHQSEAHARVETLARFLVVFPKRRISRTVIRAIMATRSIEGARDSANFLSTVSRSLLLKAISLAAMRTQNSSMLKVSQSAAFTLLEGRAPIELRVASLDVLSGYEATRTEERTQLNDAEQRQLCVLAQEQLRIGSAHSISTRLSIQYEQLSLAASYALTLSQRQDALLPLLILRHSDAQLLIEESERRLAALHTHLPSLQSALLERLTQVIDAAHQADDLTIEESLERYVDSMITLMTQEDELAAKQAQTLCVKLSQLIVIRILNGAQGPGVLRRLVRLFAPLGDQHLAHTLWSVMSAEPSHERSERVLSGLIEGVRSQAHLYQKIEALLMDALRFGPSAAVLRACELCYAFSLDDLSPLPYTLIRAMRILYQSEDVLSDEIASQIQHLACGLARVKGNHRLRSELSSLLHQLDENQDRELFSTQGKHALTLELLRAVAGDENSFSRLFDGYRLALVSSDPSPLESSDMTRELITMMNLVDPSLSGSARQWAMTLERCSLVHGADQLSAHEARSIATDLVDTMLPHPSALKVSWLMAYLERDVSSRVRSHVLLLLRSRFKYLEYASIDPLTDMIPIDWLFDEMIRRLNQETDQAVIRQWLRCISALCLKMKSPQRVERGVSLLKRVLRGEELSANASLRGVSAELLGEVGLSVPHLDLSLELSSYFESHRTQIPIALKTGIAKGLNTINDHFAFSFFEQRAEDETLELRRDGLSAMVNCLSDHRALRSLSHILTHIRELSDSEVSAVCRPILRYRSEIKSFFNEELRHRIRNYAFEKLSDQEVSTAALEASIGLIPLSVDQEDEALRDRLFELVTNVKRQGLLSRVSSCIAETFPQDFEARYEQVRDQMSDDLLPKWVMGLGDLPEQGTGQQISAKERMVSELLSWLEHRTHRAPINPENILDLSSKLLKHGYSQERSYVYDWMRAQKYRMIAYAIVKRVVDYGLRELDLPLLKDELNRYRAQLRRASREGVVMETREANTSARFEIELLDALSHFGDQEAKVDLLALSVGETQSDYERALQRAAIDKLTDEQRSYFGIDLGTD